MALQGFNSGVIRCGSALVAAAPLTMACWGYNSSFATGNGCLGVVCASAGDHDRQLFKLTTGSTGTIIARVGDGAGSDAATTTAGAADSTWFHAAMVIESATMRAAFLNGGNKGTNAASRVPSGIDRVSFGRQDNASVAPQVWGLGVSTAYMAEMALWNIALTDEDVAALAKGFSPRLVRPNALVAYLPGIRDLRDVRGSAFTISGSLTAADHCRIVNAA